jgi:hypothetical protein
MLKFLRKYNKFILVVFGSLLMVAFLMPQAIQRLGQNPRGPVVAKMGDKPLRSLDFQLASQELRFIRNVAPQFVSPGGMLGFDEDADNDAHWILLTKAANDAGVTGEDGDGKDWVPQLLQLMAEQIAQADAYQQYGQLAAQIWSLPAFAQTRSQMINDVYVNQLLPNQQQVLLNAARDAGLQSDQLDTALAKLRGIFRLIVTHNQMARLSRPRSEQEAKSIGDQAIADALFLSSSLVESEIAEPTEEQLQAHFERFRDTRAIDGEYGFGYLMPPRVKLEVLKLDHDAIANAVTLDPVAVSRRWQRNKVEFGEDFTIAKPLVEKQLRNEFADEVLRKADRHIKAFTYRARDKLERNGDYYVLPENWDEIRPTLEQTADYVIEQVEKDVHSEGNADFFMPRPVVTVLAGNWYTYTDLQAEDAIATAAVAIAKQRVPIAQLVFAVHEFEPPVEVGFQVGLPAVNLVASDAQNSHYFFTVLAAQDESPAATLDEVREKAIADYKRLAAYELLVSRSDEFKQLAITGGLQAVSDLFAKEGDPLAANIAGPDPEGTDPAAKEDATAVPGPPVQEKLVVGDPAMVQSLPGEANDELFRTAVLEAAAAIDPLTPPDEINPESAVVVVPLPARLGVELGRIRQPRPLTIETYRVLYLQASQRLVGTELRDAMIEASNPFSLGRLEERYDWVYVKARNDAEKDPSQDGADDQAATGTESSPAETVPASGEG